MNNSQLKEVEFLNKEIEKAIDKQVDEKVLLLSKSPLNKIDKDAIRQQCEEEVCKTFLSNLEKQFKKCSDFYTLLQSDNKILYENIAVPMKEKFETVQRTKDFNKSLDADEFKPSAENLKALQDLGLQWFKKENWANAHSYFSYLTCVDYNNPTAWVLKGMSEHNLEQHDEAQKSYAIALTLAPEYIFAHIQMMKCLIHCNRISDAKNYYEHFVQEFNQGLVSQDKFFTSELEAIHHCILAKAA